MKTRMIGTLLVLVALVVTTAGCGSMPTPTAGELVALSGYAGRVADQAAAAATATAEALSPSGVVTATMTVSLAAPSATITPTSTITITNMVSGETPTTTVTSMLMASPTMTPTLGVTGTLFSVSGVPATVPALVKNPAYVNTLGLGTDLWLAEPGVLTADSLADCAGNVSCWNISPDRQYVLVGKEAVSSVREDAWTLVSAARGTFQMDGMTVQLEAEEGHTWLFLVRGQNPGQGDRNVPLEASNYDAGFTLVTHLPVGARTSEQYFLAQADNALVQGNCGSSGCREVSAFFLDLNLGAWVAITLPQTGVWESVGTNFVPAPAP